MSQTPRQTHKSLNDIHQILGEELNKNDLDLVDIVPLPAHPDKFVRLRTMEEIIDERLSGSTGPNADEDVVSYIVQVKRRRGITPPPPPPSLKMMAPINLLHDNSAANVNPQAESVYTADGKINLPYLVRNAELLMNSGEFALAKNIYKTILQSGERTAMALFGLGRCSEHEGRHAEAQNHYEESIAYQPTLESYERLAQVLLLQNKDANAAQVFERTLNLKELPLNTRFELHKAAGNCWTRASRPQFAEKHYLKALELKANADDIRNNLGTLYLQQNKLAEARLHFQGALAINVNNAQAWQGLGTCLMTENQAKPALDAFAKSLTLEIRNPSAIYHLIKCAYLSKSYTTACKLVEQYIQVSPISPDLLYSLAGMQFHLGKRNDARATLQNLLQIKPNHAGALDFIKKL